MALSAERRAELKRKGAVVTTVQEWLGLTDAEMQVVEFRVAMAKEVGRRRRSARMSRKTLAERLSVSPSSITDIEHGVSSNLEAGLMAFFAMGGTRGDLASILTDLPAIASKPKGRKKAKAVGASGST